MARRKKTPAIDLGQLKKTLGFKFLGSGRAKVTRASGGKLLFNGKPAIPRLAFPLFNAEEYVEFVAEGGKVLGLLRSMSELTRPGRRTLREELDRIYYTPKIDLIEKVSGETHRSRWTVITDRGEREFTVRGRNSFRYLSGDRLLITDAEGVRYEIVSMKKLDSRSQHIISRYV